MKNTVYCAHCKGSYSASAPRYNGVLIKFTSLFLCTVLYVSGIAGINVFFMTFPLMVVGEYVKRLTNRISVVCPYCGFDLLLYKKDIKKARERVIKFREKREKKFGDLLALGSK